MQVSTTPAEFIAAFTSSITKQRLAIDAPITHPAWNNVRAALRKARGEAVHA